MKHASTQSSRASRPHRRLELDAIVQAALNVLDEVGLDDLSMRRLAEALGVQNPALYWHVRDKQELLDRMAQALLADGFAAVESGREPRSWKKKIERFAYGLRDAMRRRRDGARLLAVADLAQGPELLGRIENLVKALVDDGFAPPYALGGILTVLHYTLGATFEEQSDPRAGDPAVVPGAFLPMLSALAAGADGTSYSRLDARFVLGIAIILDGLRTRQRRSNATDRDDSTFVALGYRRVTPSDLLGAATAQVTLQVVALLEQLDGELTRSELQHAVGLTHREHFRKAYLLPALKAGLIEMTQPGKPNSRNQRYRLTSAGSELRARRWTKS